ncbi:Calcium-binding protein [Gammaproteobacteria bacterium]
MAKRAKDAEREERITMEIIVDCYNEDEQVMGWYYYLQDNLQFPFTAKCIIKRAASPLRVDGEAEVVDMAPAEECEHEMFVLIRWEQENLAVPLSQLKPITANAQTVQAVEDWHYWVERGR